MTLTLKVVSESRVTWATSMPIFFLPRPLCSRLRPDVHDRQTSHIRRASSLNAPYHTGGVIIMGVTNNTGAKSLASGSQIGLPVDQGR